MTTAIEKLLEIGGAPLSGEAPSPLAGLGSLLREEHLALLQHRNGFFAFEGALRIFPGAACADAYSLSEWNARELWRGHYGDLIGEEIFFAEDAFGGQFCFAREAVCSFDAETGAIGQLAETLEEWAAMLLEEAAYLTGEPLMQQWQAAQGPLAPRKRLMPKTPFVCGGSFALDNLVAIEAAEAMRYRGELALQIRDLPDGAQICFRVVE